MNPFVNDDPEKGHLLPGAAAPAAPDKKWSRAAPLAVLATSLFVLAGVSAASRPAAVAAAAAVAGAAAAQVAGALQ